MANVGVIYLGNFAEADTDESDWDNENRLVFDGRHDSAVLKTLRVDVTEPEGDGVAYDDDLGFAPSQITYDLNDGAGARTFAQDSVAVYSATIELGDGSTFITDINVVQLTNGDTFVTENAAGASLDGLAIQSITIGAPGEDAAAGWFTSRSIEGSSIVCFVKGTRIRTPCGDVPVERLAPGDLVKTADHGAQPIVWVSRQTLLPDARTAPIAIDANVLGVNRPSKRLLVSPQHRILLRSRIVRAVCGSRDVLVPAKALRGLPGCDIARHGAPRKALSYHHLLLARHEILIANGALVESFLPGPVALRSLNSAALASLRAHFRQVGRSPDDYQPCRKVLGGPPCADLLARHRRHRCRLFGPTAPLARTFSAQPA